MSPPIFFSVPMVPPSTNHLYEGMGRRRHRTKAYMAWLEAAIPLARQARNHSQWFHQDGNRYKLLVWIVFGTNHRNDVSNRFKAVEDALVAALHDPEAEYPFDDQFVREPRSFHCGVVKGEPRTLVLLLPLHEQHTLGVVGNINYLSTLAAYISD